MLHGLWWGYVPKPKISYVEYEYDMVDQTGYLKKKTFDILLNTLCLHSQIYADEQVRKARLRGYYHRTVLVECIVQHIASPEKDQN